VFTAGSILPATIRLRQAYGKKLLMEQRNVTAAVIGAGDYIGSAVAKKFASEGFTVFAGRRHGHKLASLMVNL
jgi:5,10-methylene-tetrahydrofolate dehydrogenase/methenyl tetrahydrofolate cyclohydrolase